MILHGVCTVVCVQEEVQLREQDFGNFQNPTKIQADLAERNRFGRFYYRWVSQRCSKLLQLLMECV